MNQKNTEPALTPLKPETRTADNPTFVERADLLGFSNNRYQASQKYSIYKPGMVLVDHTPWEELLGDQTIAQVRRRLGEYLDVNGWRNHFIPVNQASALTDVPEIAIIIAVYNGWVAKQVRKGRVLVNITDLCIFILEMHRVQVRHEAAKGNNSRH